MSYLKISRDTFKASLFNVRLISLVIYPLMAIAFYLWVLDSDRYVSSATVLIQESGSTAIEAGLFQSMLIDGQGANSDERILQAFVVSPDLLLELQSELAIRKHYASSRDFIFGISENESLEGLLKFYRKVVTVERDQDSDLLVISAHAYSPDYAVRLTEAILQKTEKFINEIGQNMAEKEMLFAEKEIQRSQRLLKKAKSALLIFQNKYSLVSPDSEGDSLVSIIYSLEAELARAQAELDQTSTYLNDDAPQILAVRSKVEALVQQIADQKNRLTGEVGGAAENRLLELGAEYQNLMLDVDLATTLYSGSLTNYEVARAKASKQLKYLVVVSEPQLPEKSLYPKRFYWLISWAVILLAVFYIVKLISTFIQEHKD